MTISLVDLLTATGGQLHGPARDAAWEDFCHDSRLAEPGQLFVALRTPTGDGHDHIAAAVARGCTGVLCQHPAPNHPPITTILVSDTSDALRAWAAHILRRCQPLVIAITGSSGKTTAKELAANLLERAYPGQVFRTRDSYNDRLGLPLALGRLRPYHRLAVVELGTDAHGEIAELAALVQPAIAAITVINDAHLGAFGSLQAIAQEKAALLRSLSAASIAILNADDPFQQPYLTGQPYHILTHSANSDAPLRLQADAPGALLTQTSATLHLDPSALDSLASLIAPLLPVRPPPVDALLLPITTTLLGLHQLVPLRVAIAIALLCGVPLAQIQAGVRDFQPLPGRLRPLPGLNDSTLLDDSYGANPAATRAALRVLATFPSPRLAILGQHSDLGPDADAFLGQLGSEATTAVDALITVGPQALAIGQGAQAAGFPSERLFHADTPAAAADLARTLLHPPGGACLIKGSREARLERTVAALLADPAAAPSVLARQSFSWRHLRLRNTLRPTWVEIDTIALADNLTAARQHLRPGVAIIAVLKADAYGHGAPTVARIVAQAGAGMLAVACLPEAQALRRAGITMPILVLGYTPPWQARPALELDLHLTVYDHDVAAALDQAAAALGRRASIHIKVDTGMSRLGLFPAETPAFLTHLRTLPHLDVVGLLTHLAAADEPAEPYTDLQLRRFDDLLVDLTHLHLRPTLVHAANTAAILTRPAAHYDAVRLGIGLYGLAPTPSLPLPPAFRPALTWKTTIAQLKTLPPDSPVGYGLTYRTSAAQTIAIIPVGYADGFRRAPQNWGYVLVRGRRAALVGRVSMDQAAIDVTAIPGVRAGDEVVLIGRQGDETITADQVAAQLGTISYEVVSTILARVPRLPE